MLEKLSYTDFTVHRNSVFNIQLSSEKCFDATLIDVSPLENKGAEDFGRTPFSLVFHIENKEQLLQQGIYRISHNAMGAFEIFLVPLGPDDSGIRYEAIFT